MMSDKHLAEAVLSAAADVERAATMHLSALGRYRAALQAFRVACPAPLGHVWEERNGAIVAKPLSNVCGFIYSDGSSCNSVAQSWDDDGFGRCEEHQ